jgi:hypothetical protein
MARMDLESALAVNAEQDLPLCGYPRASHEISLRPQSGI